MFSGAKKLISQIAKHPTYWFLDIVFEVLDDLPRPNASKESVFLEW